jgi:hypothetical protein
MRYISAADDRKKEIDKTNMSQYIISTFQLLEMRVYTKGDGNPRSTDVEIPLRCPFEGL